MIIGFIGFGKVSQNLVKIIKSQDIELVTSCENRSDKTIENIKKSGIKILDTFKDVCLKSDIVVCATSPKSALPIARQYGINVKGIYLDLNNISPDTTTEISKHVRSFVDGAIIGKIDSDNPVLYVSGKEANELDFLNEYIRTEVISNRIGDVSTLKLLRSAYTKTLSALLIESWQLAKDNGLEDEFFEIVALTEEDEFRKKSLSRIRNTLNSSKRKSEELDEIITYFDDSELIMVKAALDKLSQ